MGTRYHLLVLDGAHCGERFPLRSSRFTIGRKEKNDLVLEESTVSGFHLEISAEGEALILRDLGSTNGTLLDGRRVDEVPLAHGDTFSVGSIRVRLVDSEGGPLAEESQEVQMARVDQELLRRAGRRRPVLPLVLVLLVVAGVGAWFLLSPNRSRIGPRRGAPALAVPGNLLAPAVASLEGTGPEGWLMEQGSVPFFPDTTETHTGEVAAAAELDQGAVALLALKEPVPVSAGSRLEASLFCQVSQPGARCVLHLVFLERGSRRELLRHASAWAEEGAARFQRLALSATVPQGCDAAALAVVALGPSGRVAVDDLALIVQPSPSEATETTIRVPESPSAAVIRAGAALAVLQARGARVLSLQPVLHTGAERPRARDLELARLCFASTGLGSAHLVHPSGPGLEVVQQLEIGEDSITVVWKPLADPGPVQLLITWTLAPEVERAEIPARGGQGLGGVRLKTPQDLVALSWPRPVPYQELAGESLLRRSFLGLGSDPLRIQVAFGRDQKRAMELVRRAGQAASEGKSGEAIALIRKLLEEVPFDEHSVLQGRTLLGQLLEEGRNRLGELRARAEKAFLFAAPAELEAVARSAADLAARFQGEETLVAEAETLGNNAQALLEEYRKQERERELERLRGLKQALGEEAPALGRFLEEYIRRNLGQAGSPEGGEQPTRAPESGPVR